MKHIYTSLFTLIITLQGGGMAFADTVNTTIINTSGTTLGTTVIAPQPSATPTLSDTMRVMQYFPGDILPLENEKNMDVIKRIKRENTGLIRFRYDEQDYKYKNKDNRGTELTDRFHDIKTPLPKFNSDYNANNTYQNDGKDYANNALTNTKSTSGYIDIPLAEYYTSTYLHIQNMFPMAQKAYNDITNPYDILYGVRSDNLNILYSNSNSNNKSQSVVIRPLKNIIKTQDSTSVMKDKQSKFSVAFKTDDLYQHYAGDGADEANKTGGNITNPKGTNPTNSLKAIQERQGYTIKTAKNNLDDDIIYRSSNEYFGSNNTTYSKDEEPTQPQTQVGQALNNAGNIISQVGQDGSFVDGLMDGIGNVVGGTGDLINNIFTGGNKNNYPEIKDVQYGNTSCPTASTLQKNMYFYDYSKGLLGATSYVKDATNLKVVEYIYDYTWEDYNNWTDKETAEKHMKTNDWRYKDWNNNGASEGQIYVKDGTMSAISNGKPYTFCVPNVAMGLEHGSKFIRGKLDNSISESRNIRSVAIGFTKWMLQLVAVLAVVGVIYAGYLYMTAWGDEGNMGTAKKIIIADVIGVVLIFGSYAIVSQFTGQMMYEAPPITPEQAKLLGMNEQQVQDLTDFVNNPLHSADKTYTDVNEIDPATGQKVSMTSVIVEINTAFCNACSNHCTAPTNGIGTPKPIMIPAPEDDTSKPPYYTKGQVPPTPAGYLAAYCNPGKPELADNFAELLSDPAGAGTALLTQLQQTITTFDDTYGGAIFGEDTNNKCKILREDGKPVVWIPEDYNDLIDEYKNKYEFMCE